MLYINQRDPKSRMDFACAHHLHLEGVNGLHMLTFSGVVIVNLEAEKLPREQRKDDGWLYEDLRLELALPEDVVPAGKVLVIDQCAPFLTVNAVGGISTVGWAVDEFSGPRKDDALSESVAIKAVLGVYATGEVLHRIGYSVSVTGRIEGSH
jgi:hypothetical protein